jgi:tetratricopeptide (TPR) repeat protein
LLLIPFLLNAEEHWVEIRSGPFEVVSAGGDKPAREVMNQLEQFRHALAITLGKDDLHTVWPVQALIFKNSKQNGSLPSVFALGRESYVTANVEDHLGDLTRLLIDQNTTRLPAFIVSGLVDVFSTLQVSGTHITVGAPPAKRSRDWARIHLFLCNIEFAGRSRVFFSNLDQGGELGVAYQNAFQKTTAQIEKLVDEELAAGSETNTISGLALNPNRDFNLKTADAAAVNLLKADVLLAANAPGAEAAYNSVRLAGAAEGLAFLALKAGNKDEAKRLLDTAIEADSANARVWVEAAALEPDKLQARDYLDKAMKLNQHWAVPPYERALLENDLDKKAVLLKKATSLDSRNVEYWEELARNEAEANRFAEAQKAWGGAERAAANDEERAQVRDARRHLETERLEYQNAEHKREADDSASDLQRVKDASMAAIRKAEDDARKRLNPNGAAPPQPTEWWSGGPESAGARVEGTLERLDCVASLGRLVIQTNDGKAIQILVGDPKKLQVSCGPQKTPRKVVVLYNPKINKQMGTAGEAVSIEFH